MREIDENAPKPLTERTVATGDPELSYNVASKGGISVNGLQRFPLTLYFSQWKRLATVIEEVILFGMEHENLLSVKTAQATKDNGKSETYTVNASDLEIVTAESARLAAEGNVAEAVKLATIRSVAELNRNKVSPEAMLTIMTLKARK